MSDFSHLLPSIIDKVSCMSDQERIDHLAMQRWIGYTRAREVSEALESLYNHPRVTRMPNMLLIGRTNNGKTDIVKRFAAKHPAAENLGGEHILAPVIFVQTPPKPTENGFYAEILRPLMIKPVAGSNDTKRSQVIDILRAVQLKVLIIDEMHNTLANSSQSQHQFLNLIKYLTNELQVSIIGVGDETLLNAVSIDSQIQNRFEPQILTRWVKGAEFTRLLKSFEKILPLKKASNLSEPLLAAKILSLSEGTIGELSKLLNAAASLAIQSGVEAIDLEILNSCQFTPPSQRRRIMGEI
ncbi:TniB family NTP-binding protein [Pseudomonas sp. PSKL.D1]|uniref:TniB family NTP-binding protein n=1 Tax=Pseudomonas sp. PSKL.D1 TaxID=3029060 RepID=UPI00315902BE